MSLSPLSHFAQGRSPLSCFASRFPQSAKLLLRVCAAMIVVLPALQAQSPVSPRARAAKFAAERQSAAASRAAALFEARRNVTTWLPMTGGTTTSAWTPLGPSTILSPTFGAVTGRVTSIAVDPNDPSGNTVYLGTTGGGVWKSTNAAAAATLVTFAPLTDTLAVFNTGLGATTVPSLSIGAVAVGPGPASIVIAGTGDPNDASDSLYGEGLLRSADGGATWSQATLADNGASGKHSLLGLSTAAIAWSTASPARVVAAMSTSPEATATNALGAGVLAGLYTSADAGVTWQMATVYDGATLVQGPSSTAGNAATAVVWDALRGSFYAAIRGHGYYSSTDGMTWTRLAAQPGVGLTTVNCPAATSSSCPIFRGALAVQAATGDLYALTVDASNNDLGVWQDLCAATSGACATSAPAFATRLDGGVLEAGNGSTVIAQGDYNLALNATAASGGGTLLLAGTVDLYRCSLASGGTSCTWRNTTNAANGCNAPAGVAGSQHAIAAVALSAPLVFVGNDGGLWRSADGVAETGAACAATDKAHFDNLNAAIGAGGSLAELVGLAQSPTDANVLLSGFGALGSAATAKASSLSAWAQLSAGEGGLAAIDPATPTNWYASIGAGVNVKQCTLGAACAAANFAGSATIGEAQVAYDAAATEAPWILDLGQPANLIVGTCRVWRGTASQSSTWNISNAISTAFGGSTSACTSTSPLINVVAAGGSVATSVNAQNAGSKVIYAGLVGKLTGGGAAIGGHVFMTTSADTATNATAWTDVARSPVTNDSSGFNPNGYSVSSLAVDAHDATGATVYATVQGFGAPVLYRSTDFGAHWLNVTSNLPSAPANAVAVDPNDANTVYVATDVGVFATQAITTCATTQCWSVMGTGLPNAPVVTLTVGAALPTGDGRTGMLRVGTYGRGIWSMPLLAAVSPTAPAMTVTPSTLSFAAQQVSTASPAQSVTVLSNGTAALAVSSIAITGDFTETDNCAGKTIAINGTCTVGVVFLPTATGARSGTLTVYANVPGGQVTVSLSGMAVTAPSLVLSPASLSFPATTVNQTAAAQTLIVNNTGGSVATISAVTATGDFAVSTTDCTGTLAAGTGCHVSVTFTPTASGTRTGALSVVSNAGTSTAALSGAGLSPATDTLSPTSLSFGTQTLSTASTSQAVILTNAGDASLQQITVSTGSSEFVAANGCGAVLAAHSSCTISVSFAPSAVGARSATLTVTDAFRTQTVSLSGTGVAPAGVSLTPSSLAFGAIGVGLASPAQTLTFTNNGGVTLTLGSAAVSGDYVIATNTCGTALAVSSACTLTVVFSPTSAGVRSGALTVATNAGTQTVPLSGTGVDFTLASTGTTSATMNGASGTVTFPLLLSSVSAVTSTASLSCTGAPAHTTCVVSPASVSLGGTVNVSVTVATGVAAMHSSRDLLPWTIPTIVLACMMPWIRRRRAVAMLGLLLLVGCGTGRTVPASGGGGTTTTPTPSGTYNLTVSAAAAGVTHAVPLTLVVQ